MLDYCGLEYESAPVDLKGCSLTLVHTALNRIEFVICSFSVPRAAYIRLLLVQEVNAKRERREEKLFFVVSLYCLVKILPN